jgi:hypothetical protein
MIGYLDGKSIKQLLSLGVTKIVYSTSSTMEHLGDLTAVYFLDDNCYEQAHQTMLSKTFTQYKRNWGGIVSSYYEVRKFSYKEEDLQDSVIYRLI